MTPFFESAERQNSLESVVDSWLGTRFVPGLARKGVGADCVRFVVAVLQECGANVNVPSEWPRYRSAGCGESGRRVLEEGLKTWVICEHVETSDLVAGDILTFKIQNRLRTAYHLGLIIRSGKFVHCVPANGVCFDYLNHAPWSRELCSVERLMES